MVQPDVVVSQSSFLVSVDPADAPDARHSPMTPDDLRAVARVKQGLFSYTTIDE